MNIVIDLDLGNDIYNNINIDIDFDFDIDIDSFINIDNAKSLTF